MLFGCCVQPVAFSKGLAACAAGCTAFSLLENGWIGFDIEQILLCNDVLSYFFLLDTCTVVGGCAGCESCAAAAMHVLMLRAYASRHRASAAAAAASAASMRC